MTYQALITRVHTREHPNANALKLGLVHGYQVVVGIDTEDGQLGVFFDADGQVSEEYAAANDLIGYTDPETGEKKGGFFGKNRRVRSQKFRGEKSDGYFAPLESLAFTGFDLSTLSEGDAFEELNGVPICNKYFTPKTLKAMLNGQPKKRENLCFPKHSDTAQIKHQIDQIPEGAVLRFTLKMHGTSGRFGYVLDEHEAPRTFWQKVLRRKPVMVSEYKHLNGTRNVIQADHSHAGFYGNEEFRWNAVEKLEGNLFKGEVLYFELTGYTTTGQPIMGEVDTRELKDIAKQYGRKMVYKYGQVPGTTGLWVYRITRSNEDGVITELSWREVQKRCRELGINSVPEIMEPCIYDGDQASLLDMVEDCADGPDIVDPSHIREGVVIRVEHEDTKFYKNKGFSFKFLEGLIKDNDNYVDMEEVG